MAEARNAIDLYYLQKRGVKLGPSYDGYYTFTITVPTFSTFVSQVALFGHRVKYSILNKLWPATPATLLCVMGGVTYFVVNSNQKSWVRSGWLAEALWRADTALGVFNPLHPFFPTSFRVGYLASTAAFVGMLGIVSVERMCLRVLLSWQGWLYGGTNKILTTMWGAGVKVLTGSKNMTYAFNLSLPNLPLPSLQDTIDRYLNSVRPLMDKQEYERTVALSLEFQRNEGRKFQRYLFFRHLITSNYIQDWWEKYCYLYGRTPIMINSNYYVLDSKQRPTTNQVQRAAGITHHFLRFKDMIENEALEPMTIRGLIPLCMSQYERMFGTCRIPGRECDTLQHFDSRHICVVSRGHIYKLHVYHGAKGTRRVPYSTEEIEEQLQLIVEHSKRQSKRLPHSTRKQSHLLIGSQRIQSFEDLVVLDSMREHRRRGSSATGTNPEPSGLRTSRSTLSFRHAASNSPSVKHSRRGLHIGSFTAGPRGRWSEVRDLYFSEGVNKKSLRTIERAAFVLYLEDNHYTTMTERAKSIFHGNGSNRWFDKSVNLVVFEDGYAGLNCEHSWADAPAIAHLWEFALLNELIDFQKKKPKTSTMDEGGDVLKPLQSEQTAVVKKKKLPVPTRLLWEIDDELQVAIDQAHAFSCELIEDLDLEIVEHLEYGKGFIKKCKMSPDGFIQMSLQLAYFRNQGRFDLTYESSMTRLFRGGRTETTRSLSTDSVNFVRAIESYLASGETTKQEVIDLLRKATNSHAEKNKDAMTGKGVDRHLFALYIVSKGMDMSSDFLNEALTIPWKLSTSQQPQDQTLLRNDLPPEDAKRFVSPGGGFGPVDDQGYGVSYMFAGETQFFFHISSKKSCPLTSSEKFALDIQRALEDMSALFN